MESNVDDEKSGGESRPDKEMSQEEEEIETPSTCEWSILLQSPKDNAVFSPAIEMSKPGSYHGLGEHPIPCLVLFSSYLHTFTLSHNQSSSRMLQAYN